MPPKRKGRSRSSSRSRPQSADQPEIEQEEEKKDPIHQEEDQEEEEEPPQDVPLQVAAGAMPQALLSLHRHPLSCSLHSRQDSLLNKNRRLARLQHFKGWLLDKEHHIFTMYQRRKFPP